MKNSDLPIHEILGDICASLRRDPTLIIEAPPGAGKTTLVPLALLDEPWTRGRRIVMLQPRRLAARSAAARMAELLGESVGDTVGYRVRLDSKVSQHTRIEVITEGLLLRMLQEDPSLEDVAALVFDEFHERSLDADLGLTLALQARETFERNPALRILVMSATLAAQELEQFLQAPCVRSEGRMFPVELHYGRSSAPRERIAVRCREAIEHAVARHQDSSFLVFLPGQGEIRELERDLSVPADLRIHTLYGELSLEAQRAAVAPGGQRKLVLATNIAETSLTIEGVDVVIDSGLERRAVFDPNSGMSRLHTTRISRASSEQRSGRAGRLRPGHCYRLWSEAQQQELQAQREPEILNADLSAMLLQLHAFGCADPDELRWLSPPPAGALQQAGELLGRLGAVDQHKGGPRLLPHGLAMAGIGVHPRLAHMLLTGQSIGAAHTAADLAAVLSERDPVSRESADMRTRLEYLSGELDCPARLRGWLQRSRQLAGQFRKQLPRESSASALRPADGARAGFLIACAYPDRIARSRHSGGFQLAGGRSCQFESPSPLSRQKWLAVAEVSGTAGRRSDIIRSAAPLDPALFDHLLSHCVTEDTVVQWEKDSGRFVAERRKHCGALILSRETIRDVPEEARVRKLLDLTVEASLANLPWNAATRQYLARAQLMERLEPNWPAFAEEALVASADEWLAPFLAPVRKLADLARLELLAVLKARLSWEQQQLMERSLPERYAVPSGSRIAIDYREQPPVLAVKLQEMFGCETTPTVADGRIALQLHLLSPAGRPLQVTQDLQSFWRDGYRSVQKEMKGRYPKHPWPDNPLAASGTRHTKRRS